MPSFIKRKTAGKASEPTMQPLETYETVISGQTVTVKRYGPPQAQVQAHEPGAEPNAAPRPPAEMIALDGRSAWFSEGCRRRRRRHLLTGSD